MTVRGVPRGTGRCGAHEGAQLPRVPAETGKEAEGLEGVMRLYSRSPLCRNDGVGVAQSPCAILEGLDVLLALAQLPTLATRLELR